MTKHATSCETAKLTPPVVETRPIVQQAMKNTPAGFAVPLKVDIKIGRTWADCKWTNSWRRCAVGPLATPLGQNKLMAVTGPA